jgi:hypothetical protein
MQITLNQEQYDRLRREAERTGASLAELIRRAVDDKYGRELSLEEKLAAAERTAGIWTDEQAEEWERRREADKAKRRRMLGL